MLAVLQGRQDGAGTLFITASSLLLLVRNVDVDVVQRVNYHRAELLPVYRVLYKYLICCIR